MRISRVGGAEENGNSTEEYSGYAGLFLGDELSVADLGEGEEDAEY
jgi:hypothetical protein